MLALMHPQSSNPSPATSYWYSSNSLPDALDGLPQDGPNPRAMRRASEAVVQAAGFQSQEPSEWDAGSGPLHLDTNPATLAIRPQGVSAAQAHKAPLAPKQGLGGALANARGQHQSPISGTYALRTPRGKITSIACESCRKRKSKCDGVRPKCNTCQSKNLTCIYDVAEDGKTTTQLRAHLRRVAKENEELRAMLPLLARAPRGPAVNAWADEMEKRAFQHHPADEVRKALLDPSAPPPGLPDADSFGTPSSEPFIASTQGMGPSSYDGSSREESREHSQTALAFVPEAVVEGTAPMNPPPLDTETQASNLNKFGFDCAYYRRAKRDLLRNGWNPVDIFGRSEVDVDTMLLGFVDTQDNQPVSTWCSRTTNKLLPQAPLPVRLASTWLLTKLMRYLIWPTMENMNANPEWLLPPMGKQENSPYDMLIDLVPWPQVRQLLYQHANEIPVTSLVGLIGITWPYADDACHYWDIDAGYTRLTPLFETTIADLNSWTIDPKALEILPQLEGHIPIKPIV